MIPKEKAIELVEKFMKYASHYPMGYYLIQKDNAKKCALIAVDEIIDSDPIFPYDGGYYETVYDRVDNVKLYWEQVKEEINKL